MRSPEWFFRSSCVFYVATLAPRDARADRER
jgi:hypothetical protein